MSHKLVEESRPELTHEWIPRKSFSIFEFGSPVEPYRFKGYVEREPLVLDEDQLPFDGCYSAVDDSCLIYSLGSLIHVIDCSIWCIYDGYNVIGSKIDRVLQILGFPAVRWKIESAITGHYLDCKEGVIDSLGITLWVENLTNIVSAVSLIAGDRGHERRIEEAG